MTAHSCPTTVQDTLFEHCPAYGPVSSGYTAPLSAVLRFRRSAFHQCQSTSLTISSFKNNCTLAEHMLLLQVGDLVYARVTSADRDLDPVLACVDAQGKVSYQHFDMVVKPTVGLA